MVCPGVCGREDATSARQGSDMLASAMSNAATMKQLFNNSKQREMIW